MTKFIQSIIFDFLIFKNILLVADGIMNLSRFFCISINPVTFKRKKSFWNKFYFIVSDVFSFIAYSYKTVLPIRSITHFRILEFLVNTLNLLSVYYFLFIFEMINFIQYQGYRNILNNLQRCNIIVRLLFL